jgi:hypothetical protein
MYKLDAKMAFGPGTLRNAIAPVCMLVADSTFMNNSCFGTIGKAGKFCTKLRDDSGDTTCGTRAHVKKAVLQEGYIYFWDASSNIGYCTPTLDSRVKLAGAVWEMRGQELDRVQVKELMEAVTRGDAITVLELVAIKARVLNPSSGVSFTPRKKPRYSEDTWEFPDLENLPAIAEGGPELEGEDLQDHVGRQWKDLVQAVETLKTVAGRNNKYEHELDALGEDINGLRAALARVLNLVGLPVDGIQFDLFGIIDRNKPCWNWTNGYCCL